MGMRREYEFWCVKISLYCNDSFSPKWLREDSTKKKTTIEGHSEYVLIKPSDEKKEDKQQ